MLIQAMVVQAKAAQSRTSGGAWEETSLSAAAEVVPFLDRVEAAMTDLGNSPRTCWELRLVLEEAIVNALKHGNGGDPSKQVHIYYYVGPGAVLADIEDEGPGFDPWSIPDPTLPENLDRPSGRGLFLMRSYTTWVSYYGRGNIVTLCKLRPAEGAEQLRY